MESKKDYIELNPDLRRRAEKLFAQIRCKRLSEWSVNEANLYRALGDYPRRKEFLVSLKQPVKKQVLKESGWIGFYKIVGWIFVIGGLIVFVALMADNKEEEAAIGATMFGCGIGCLISAHILRLLEKGIHYLKSIDEKMKD